MDYLHGAYLVASVGVVAYLYRSTFKVMVRQRNPVLLFRPVVVLLIAYVSGLNVPAIGESAFSFMSPRIAEPLFYLATLLALVALSLVPFLRPIDDDTHKPL